MNHFRRTQRNRTLFAVWGGRLRRRRRQHVCRSHPVRRWVGYIESITMALLRCSGLVQKWHALASPCARAAAANIAAGSGYSERGRRPAAATPSVCLFSDHNLQLTIFASKYRRCQRTSSLFVIPWDAFLGSQNS